MSITKEEVQIYLGDMKEAVRNDRYNIEQREVNDQLFQEYLINETKIKEILLDLCVEDFCDAAPNKHPRYYYEILYVFGKDVLLMPRYEEEETVVSLYIKFNKLDNHYTIVVSFHKQKYPLKYKFK